MTLYKFVIVHDIKNPEQELRANASGRSHTKHVCETMSSFCIHLHCMIIHVLLRVLLYYQNCYVIILFKNPEIQAVVTL